MSLWTGGTKPLLNASTGGRAGALSSARAAARQMPPVADPPVTTVASRGARVVGWCSNEPTAYGQA